MLVLATGWRKTYPEWWYEYLTETRAETECLDKLCVMPTDALTQDMQKNYRYIVKAAKKQAYNNFIHATNDVAK